MGGKRMSSRASVKHEEVKNKLLRNPWVREAYENPPLHLATARAVVERRKELGMTQEELAAKMGTSQSQVWRIESGAFNPTSKTLARLEGALGISFGKLYREYQQAAELAPEEQLGEWRDIGLLVMSDEDFDMALELEKATPGQLSRLVRMIEGIELDEGDCIQVTVTITGGEGSKGAFCDEAPRRLALSATL
jgi:transcriptional regulator with XRE-family HTH domain